MKEILPNYTYDILLNALQRANNKPSFFEKEVEIKTKTPGNYKFLVI